MTRRRAKKQKTGIIQTEDTPEDMNNEIPSEKENVNESHEEEERLRDSDKTFHECENSPVKEIVFRATTDREINKGKKKQKRKGETQ